MTRNAWPVSLVCEHAIWKSGIPALNALSRDNGGAFRPRLLGPLPFGGKLVGPFAVWWNIGLAALNRLSEFHATVTRPSRRL